MTADAAAEYAAEVEVCAADGFESGTESLVSFLIESLFPCLLLGECLRAEKRSKNNIDEYDICKNITLIEAKKVLVLLHLYRYALGLIRICLATFV